MTSLQIDGALPRIGDLVPHQPPMVWLDELVDWRPGYAKCHAKVRPHTPFVVDGQLGTETLLEYMAQAVAACLGYGALRNGESIRVGMIVACRSMDLFVPTVPVGADLVVEARRQREVDEVSNYAGTVELEGEVVAAVEMTLYHASEPPKS